MLSAGVSPYLREVLNAAAAAKGRRDELVVVWSGRSETPQLPGVDRLDVIAPTAFDHGSTRQRAIQQTSAEFVAFLSDDATPASPAWLERLLGPFDDHGVGAVFGRHVARADSPLADRVFREARYVGSSGDVTLDRRGRLAAIAPISNANAAYRVTAVQAIGGIPGPFRFAEDREAATRLLVAGWRVRYEADAAVLHTHYHSRSEILARGRSAVSFTLLAGGLGGAAGLARFAWRGARAAWAAAGPRGLIGLGSALGLRAAGFLGARLGGRRT